MVLNISEEEFQQLKGAVMDRDQEEAFRLVKLLIRRLEQQLEFRKTFSHPLSFLIFPSLFPV